MAAQLGGDDAPIADINIVPFVDIILVVLIIFMVTTPFIVKPSIPINLPKAASGEETASTALNIGISASGVVQLNGKTVSDEAIIQAAKKAVAKNPNSQAVISADKDVAHGKVVGIIDLVKSSGVRKFAITIDKE